MPTVSYADKFIMRWEGCHGADRRIIIQEAGYTGEAVSRALGRAPVLRRETNECIRGTSLEIYAECRVDGEFSILYTSDPQKYKVLLQQLSVIAGVSKWSTWFTGYLSTELYSEPDIAPPYDVELTATDGLGELKLYEYEARGGQTLYEHLKYLLRPTGQDYAVRMYSRLAVNNASNYNSFLADVVVDLDHMVGETRYDVLNALLASLHATIAREGSSWAFIRESDIEAAYSSIQGVWTVQGYDVETRISSRQGMGSLGSMSDADYWPVGYLSSKVVPAKSRQVVVSEYQYHDLVMADSDMRDDFTVPLSLSQAFPGLEAIPSSELTIRAGVDSIIYNAALTLRVYTVNNSGEVVSSLTERGAVSSTSSPYVWVPTDTPLDITVAEELNQLPFDPTDYNEITIPLPVKSIATSGRLCVEITASGTGASYVRITSVTLAKTDRFKGYRDTVILNNSARGESDEVSLIIGDWYGARTDGGGPFMYGLPTAGGARVSSWHSKDFTSRSSLLSLMAVDYAKSVAAPRLRKSGVLNAVLGHMPIFMHDGTQGWIVDTYEYDLLNDEATVELLSLPAVELSVTSETINKLK